MRDLVHLRTLAPYEVDLHRDLRLRAHLDSPHSFGETLAVASARPRSYWEELTRSVTNPEGDVMFLAYEGKYVLGCVYGMLDREHAGEGRIGGTWVQAEYRNRSVGSALVQEVFAWARQRGLKRLGLWAPAHEPAAIALYWQAGFRPTGDRRPLPTNSSLWIMAMKVHLDASPV